MEYDNTNRGSVWKNDRKNEDWQADFTGSINVDGKDYWLECWKRKEGAKENAPLLSFRVKPKDQAKKPTYVENQDGVKEFNDEVPF